MKIGINRNKTIVEFKGFSFEVSIVPIYAESLIADHDKKEKEFRNTENPSVEQSYEYMIESINLLLAIVESILLANGYEFDEDFWRRNADARALIEFIADCKLKDFQASKKKEENEK